MSFALLLSLALAQAEADAPVIEEPTVAPRAEASVGQGDTRSGTSLAPDTSLPWWQRVTIGGFARVGAFFTFPFRDQAVVGGNGGFRLADLRINLDFHPVERFTAYVSVEFAAPLPNALDPTHGQRIVDLRDAYVGYEFHDAFIVRLGQQRPGYYAEMLISDGLIPFVSRSVIANGLAPPDGYPRTFLAPDRQLGLNISSNRLGSEWIGFKYAVGVYNGNGQNQLFNDNNSFMPVARAEIDVKQLVTLGVNGYYNVRTEGTRPTQLSTEQYAFGADLGFNWEGLSLLGGFLGKIHMYDYAGLPPDQTFGAMGQARYFHEGTGLEIAARFAWYEPSTVQADDALIEVAAMVGWRPFKLPFRVLAQYTHRNEEQLASYPNDSVDFMVHAVW